MLWKQKISASHNIIMAIPVASSRSLTVTYFGMFPLIIRLMKYFQQMQKHSNDDQRSAWR